MNINKGDIITYTSTIPFSSTTEVHTARVVALNYSFDRITGVYVEGTPVVIWLDQIQG
jgi:hypothetical protein